MVDIGRYIYEDGKVDGIADGEAKRTSQYILTLMKKGMTFEQAVEMLEVPEDEITKHHLLELKDKH